MWLKPLLALGVLAFALSGPIGGTDSRAQTIEPNWAFQRTQADERGQNIISLREAVDIVRGRYGGELISARLEQGGRPVYVLRWRLPNQSVQDFRVDAVSGQMR